MTTNRDVIRMAGFENLLFHLYRIMLDNFDHMRTFGMDCPKYECILEMIECRDIDEYCDNYSGCRECISRWLDEEYNGTWEIEVPKDKK